MGRVAGSYGVRGWIRVEAAQAALRGLQELVDRRARVSRRADEGAFRHAAREARGLESREAAQKLKGSKVFVQREALPEPEAGHYYLADLVGLEVVNEQGVVLGVVKRGCSTARRT